MGLNGVCDMTTITISENQDEGARCSMITKTYIWGLIFQGPGYDTDWVAHEHDCPYCHHTGTNNGLFTHLQIRHGHELNVMKLEQIFQRLQGMNIEFERYRRKDIDDAIEYLSRRFDEKGTLDDV